MRNRRHPQQPTDPVAVGSSCHPAVTLNFAVSIDQFAGMNLVITGWLRDMDRATKRPSSHSNEPIPPLSKAIRLTLSLRQTHVATVFIVGPTLSGSLANHELAANPDPEWIYNTSKALLSFRTPGSTLSPVGMNRVLDARHQTHLVA